MPIYSHPALPSNGFSACVASLPLTSPLFSHLPFLLMLVTWLISSFLNNCCIFSRCPGTIFIFLIWLTALFLAWLCKIAVISVWYVFFSFLFKLLFWAHAVMVQRRYTLCKLQGFMCIIKLLLPLPGPKIAAGIVSHRWTAGLDVLHPINIY